MKSLPLKKPPKDEREKRVLLGLVDLYLTEGRPIASQTLRQHAFEGMSSATIRNYFCKLEQDGYLKQQHSSGGRIPTEKAFRLYAEEVLKSYNAMSLEESDQLQKALAVEGNEVTSYLHRVAEFLSSRARSAVFLTSPRFEQDFVFDVRLIALGGPRYLAVIQTDFGSVETEVLYLDKKVSSFSLKRIEQFFRFKMTGLDKPVLEEEERLIAENIYQEVMLRYIIKSGSDQVIDLYKTGFSQLLSYPDFNGSAALAQGLMLFENDTCLISLLSQAVRLQKMEVWIGEELTTACPNARLCSAAIVPYKIHQSVAGAIGILGPMRMPYRELFALLEVVSDIVSKNLTRMVYKHKLTFRQPKKVATGPFEIEPRQTKIKEEEESTTAANSLLLVDQSS